MQKKRGEKKVGYQSISRGIRWTFICFHSCIRRERGYGVTCEIYIFGGRKATLNALICLHIYDTRGFRVVDTFAARIYV